MESVDFLANGAAIAAVGGFVMPFVVQFLKREIFPNKFDSRIIAIMVAIVFGVAFSLLEMFKDTAFVQNLVYMAGLVWLFGTKLYKEYKDV